MNETKKITWPPADVTGRRGTPQAAPSCRFENSEEADRCGFGVV